MGVVGIFLGWLNKKNHIQGVLFIYHLVVLEYIVIIKKLSPKGTSYGARNEEDE